MDALQERLRTALRHRYRIERQLGEGGMATVYLAADLKHERQVALKVLKPELAAAVGAKRFLAEIKTTANLQHPHILPLFDSGEADGFLFYVMPYVEGESLRDRLDREHQLPVDDAVKIATNLAEALDYAHRRGVIHRDIKPANVLLFDGKPVISDFGIALALGVAGGGRLTETGLSLGTPQYMSPEQATGDARVGPATDIYALACVLYEMLVGEPPYTGSTAQAVLGKIIAGEAVSARKSRATIPTNVDAVIRRALEKLPADRFSGAQDFAKALADPGFRHGDGAVAGVGGGVGPWKRLAIAFAGVAVLFALTSAWGMLRKGTPIVAPGVLFRMALTDFELNAPPGSGRRLAISRDGSQIALASLVDGVSKIFLRDAGQRDFREVPGTEGANNPDFSPDGRWLVFEAGGRLSRVQVSGGPVLPIAQGTDPHWGLDDVVVFQGPGGLYRVAPSGGDPVLILDGGVGDSRPFLLPDGEAVVFQRGGTGLEERLMLVEIDSGEVTDLGVTGSNPRYVPTGYLVFGQPSQALMAVPFDLKAHRVTGPPSTVLPDVTVSGGGATQFAVSETGTAVYMTGGGAEDYELVWVSRGGAVEPVDSAWTGDFQFPASSPDGTRLAVDIKATESRDVWVKQLDRGPSLKLTIEGTDNTTPTWTPDGESVTYRSNRAGGFDLWTKRADGRAQAVVQLDRERNLAQALWSPDGEWLVYRTDATDPEGADILALRPGQDTLPTALVATKFVEQNMALSPDGRWLAYRSNETGPAEIYVVPFPNAGDAKWAVSTSGGSEPVWSNSGRELFYRNGRGEMVAVPILAGETFVLGQPEVLFSATGFRSATNLPMYDVAPNDQRFIMIRQLGAATASEVVVVVNWFEELKARTKVRSP